MIEWNQQENQYLLPGLKWYSAWAFPSSLFSSCTQIGSLLQIRLSQKIRPIGRMLGRGGLRTCGVQPLKCEGWHNKKRMLILLKVWCVPATVQGTSHMLFLNSHDKLMKSLFSASIWRWWNWSSDVKILSWVFISPVGCSWNSRHLFSL